MAKTSQIDQAIAKLEAEIHDLENVLARLLAVKGTPAAKPERKPRKAKAPKDAL